MLKISIYFKPEGVENLLSFVQAVLFFWLLFLSATCELLLIDVDKRLTNPLQKLY